MSTENQDIFDQVLFSIDSTLESFLKKNVKNKSNTLDVQITSPSSAEKKEFTASLCLYKLEENPFYKNNDGYVLEDQKNENKFVEIKRFRPAVFDLYYLITPFSNSNKINQIIRLQIIRAFHDNPILSGTNLKNKLASTGNSDIKVTWNSILPEESNHLGSLFGGIPFQLSLAYKVSPIIIESQKILETKRVKEKIIEYHQKISKNQDIPNHL